MRAQTRVLLGILISALSCSPVVAAKETVFSILDHGVSENDESSYDVEFRNAMAFSDTINAANNYKRTSAAANETVVAWVPDNGGFYSLMPVAFEYLDGITIRIDGYIKASKRHTRYPMDYHYNSEGRWKQNIVQFLEFDDCSNLVFEGSGTVDGQGFMWWLREYIRKNPADRPHLMYMNHCQHVEFTGIKWMNSPQYHLLHVDVDSFYYHDFEIYVDWWGQFILGQFFLARDDELTINGISLPTFPLNTDGIDPFGSNILIERVNITNFDDAVAVKPQNKRGQIAQCSENIVVRDCEVTFGVGMTIGSVPPDNDYNCVRNVTFERIVFNHPFKAIYVKTNPGSTSSMLPGSGGEITNVLYKDITIHHPIWWSIYIGPQQQKQPGGAGPGCLLYPFGGCETQPLIQVANITLQNVNQYGNLLPPGVVRCNETNPCYGINFENVNADGWWKWFGFNYITENIHGDVQFSTPAPAFINDNEVESYDVMGVLVEIAQRSQFHFVSLAKEIRNIVGDNGGLLNIFHAKDALIKAYSAFAF